ncbi:hypothetical protein DSO57_1010095 [Entomophthora muscae]|uniref:Uncharacterized protein n=1 Tax=Entomophthora muscae TaxID=34485 RepID=A0ACC2U568_9FUNG|nr:hypothetical protein DSO57_1010095 [Entomophthora muscae]
MMKFNKFFLLALPELCQGLNVMIHSDIGTASHVKPLFEIGKVLIERNHSVSYAAPDINKKYLNNLPFEFYSLGQLPADPSSAATFKQRIQSNVDMENSLLLSGEFGKTLARSYNFIYPQLSALVLTAKPDVLICDFMSPVCRDVAIIQQIPLITGLQTTDGFGLIDSPLTTTSMHFKAITIDTLSFYQRFIEKVVLPLKNFKDYHQAKYAINKARRNNGVPPSSPFGDLSSTLAIANTFVGFEAAVPLTPNLKLVGPIRPNSTDPLTPELTDFLTSHTSVVYVAFGSLLTPSHRDITNIIQGALTALDNGTIDGIIWGLSKITINDFPETFTVNNKHIKAKALFDGSHPHVKLLSWAPQTSILNHPSTRIFISHGGLESTFEAILSTTPMLCIPFLADQPRNALKVEAAGIGKYMPRTKANPELITHTIQDILDDASGEIKVNMRRMYTLAQQGTRRKAEAADAIEDYVATAKECRPFQPHSYYDIACEAKHLIPARMSYIQASLIDVYSAAALVSIIGIATTIYIGCSIIPKLFPSTKLKLN